MIATTDFNLTNKKDGIFQNFMYYNRDKTNWINMKVFDPILLHTGAIRNM